MSQERTVADQAARDRASGDLKSSLMVEAGAGTGKTTVLVARVAELLKTDIPLERIAVITFTEKAAGELKTRLRGKVEEMLGKAAQGAWSDHLRRSLESLDRATVSTIHAFAASLLRERPVEAQVDPRFVVSEELTTALLMEQTWERWVEREMTEGALPLARALRLGLRLERIRALAFDLVEQRDLDLSLPPAGQDGLAAARDRILKGIGELDRLSRSCQDESDKALEQIRRLSGTSDLLRQASGDRLLMALEGLILQPGKGSQAAWRPAADLKASKDLLAAMESGRAAAVEKARALFAHELAGWIRDGFLPAYQQEKQARRLLDFTDLLILTRDMLRDSAPARSAFQDRFDCLLVDEFQDTDPLQAEILFLLAADDPTVTDWRLARPRRGKLFVVGDPKQSIYRFRRADIEIYEDVKGLLKAASPPGASDHPRLTQSFRTVPSIAAWVNELFTHVMTPSDRRWQPDYEPIVPYREEPDDRGSRVVMLVPGRTDAAAPAEAESVPGRRAAEARAVVSLLLAAREGKWDPGGRPLAWGEMALLFRATTAVEIYEDALREARVPYRMSGGKRYYMRVEMRALLAVLQAIESPHDPLAVVSALRSPFFGHTDEELLSHAASKRSWAFTRREAGQGTPFERAFDLLAGLHARRNERPVASTLEALLEQGGALCLFYLKPDGDQRAANLLKAIDLARAHEAAGGGGYGSFVRWLAGMAADEREEAEAPLAEEAEPDLDEDDEGSVRILTVHKAKGLEFPLVVLCDPNGRGRSEHPSWIAERGGAGTPRLEFCLGPARRRFASAGYVDAAAREKERLRAESHRLLYVAGTRARDWLVIPVFHEGQPDGVLRILAEHRFLPQEGSPPPRGGARVVAASSLPEAPREARVLRLHREEGGPREPALIAEREGWRRALKSALEAPVGGRELRAASSLELMTRPAVAVSGPGARAARALGTAVHGVLERIDLATGRDLGILCEEEAASAGRPDLAPEVRVLVERARASRIVKEALAAPRSFRELPFVLAGDTFLSEGSCDLVFESGGSLTIVDFKTDAVLTPAEIDARAAAYRPQALVYARALSQIVAIPIARVVLHFVRADAERVFRVDEAFLKEARNLLETPSVFARQRNHP